MTLFFLQFAGECQKLFARKRTYIGFGIFFLVEIALVLLLQLPRNRRFIIKTLSANGYGDAEFYFSGLTLGFFVLIFAVMLIGSLYLALVAGDIVSKEVEDGTMRMMLCRPISRFRLLLVKYLACILYTIVLTIFAAVSALLVGLFYRGPGGLFAVGPDQGVFALYPFAEGLQRYALSIPLLAFSLVTVTSIGFVFSCLRMKPSTATIVTMSIFMVDWILFHIPFFEGIKTYFLFYKMSHWVLVYDYVYSWAMLAENYVQLAAVQLTLFVLGWLAIEFRDFKN